MMEEKELVRLSQQGDKESFGLLVKRYETKVHHLAFQFTRNNAVSDDLAQEIFIKAYFGLPKFKGQSGFGTWLYRIGVNHIKDYLRKKPKELSLEVVPEDRSGRSDAPAREQEARDDAHRRSVVRACLQAMPSNHRIILTLRDIEGLSYDEVARTLRISPGTVDSRLFRARQMLRKQVVAFLEKEGRAL
ncbi:MAG: sigma-70 family RNA polymerase sigma factor [Candidatus Aminicenantes bacterium]|nr:sigma-70 family RNA polymerase sigma factor [Candidatus Aminicenantes bacterium]